VPPLAVLGAGRNRRRSAAAIVGLLLASTVPLRAAEESTAAIALEADLAQKPDLYLVLDPGAKRLTVRARGIELATVEVEEVSRLVFRPLFGGTEPPPLELPAVWTVLEGPGDTDRETIAPTTLRPYSEEDDKEEAPASSPAAKAPNPNGDEATPSSFRVQLDVGWQLFLVNEPPRLNLLRRFTAAVRDGWLRLRGEEPSHPPLVTLVVAPEDARRLHHLFRSGMPILVLGTG
jgi:hypothetical protein